MANEHQGRVAWILGKYFLNLPMYDIEISESPWVMTIFKQGLTDSRYNTNIESLSSSKINYSNWVISGQWVQIWPQLRIENNIT